MLPACGLHLFGKSVSLSEEPASEGGRLIALGGLLPAGRILPAKR